MSERFKIEVIDKRRGVPTCLHVVDTEEDNEIVYVTYSMSDAEAYVREHAERPSLAERAEMIHYVETNILACGEPSEIALWQRGTHSWHKVTCPACLNARALLAEQDRIARMLAECMEVREAASRQIAEFTEIRDRALSVERRLRARLSGPVSARDGAGAEVWAEAPRAFLADLRQYATVQQMNAAHEYGASRAQLNQPVLYKPMPY